MMKINKLTLVTLIVLGSVNTMFSQSSLFKNKLALEYDLGVAPLTNEYSNLTIGQKLKSTKYFNSISLNYRVASKMAISIGYGFHKNDLSYRYGEYNYNEDKISDYKVYMTGREFDLGLKFYFRHHRAPMGNSFDVFVKQQSFVIDVDELADYVGNDAKIDMTLIGVKLNYITVLSKKMPLYLKYSASFFAPIIRNMELPTSQPNNIQEDNYDIDYRAGGADDYEVINNYRNINWFKLHVGLGWAF
ncbi:hypothetical protein N9K26_02470 [Flavobacteriales bacterium]|jgi:hypothetical protein|nr:hypothetical protein [Flavobacteriales bacterium]